MPGPLSGRERCLVKGRVLDKTAPFDFYLNPGTYVIDVTMSGYRGLHKVINVEQGRMCRWKNP